MKSDTEEPSNNRPTLVKVGRRKLISFARRLTADEHIPQCRNPRWSDITGESAPPSVAFVRLGVHIKEGM
jgi:hypothetical protein